MRMRVLRRRMAFALVLVAGLVTLPVAPPASALGIFPWFIETPVNSTAPDASLVTESYVSLYAPLPAADGPRPAACDRIGYLRFRNPTGPSDPAQAAAIFVAQPGIFEGAGALDQVARNTVRAAAAKGYSVEFWALNPRSNCLEDDLGVQVAAAFHSPQPALSYYYGNQSLFGQKFAGVVSEQNAAFLSYDGLAQTVQDEYTVISQLPPEVRRTKVLCGGHSLGGLVTGAFANWDFSGIGIPAAAGYNQCAGFFALDTRFTITGGTQALSQSADGALSSILQSANSSSSPYIDAAPFTPEVFEALPILGLAAFYQPNQTNSSVIDQLPDDSAFDSTYRLLFANSWSDFLTDSPDVRQFNVTNQATVGLLFGNVSDPIGILRAGVGVPTGGPVVEKSFPLPYASAPELAGLLGGNDLISPDPASATPDGPIYSWLNYNQVPTPGPSPADDPGHPYTSAASEVSDINQLSAALFEAPAQFTEDYFPTQLVIDILAVELGDRSGTLTNLRYSDGIAQRPTAYVDAGNGITPDLGSLSAVPPGPSPQVHVVAPGYNHLDVVTAAYQQNNGQPEITSGTLASWMGQIVGPPAG